MQMRWQGLVVAVRPSRSGLAVTIGSKERALLEGTDLCVCVGCQCCDIRDAIVLLEAVIVIAVL